MPLRRAILCSALALAGVSAAFAAPPVVREEVGNRVSENIPVIPAALVEQLNRYQNTRGATFAGWTGGGCMLISTRFAETAQAHRVCQPMGMREQLTFYPEPLAAIEAPPVASKLDGFVFGKDVGGNEFWQLHWFDMKSRDTTLLTDGKARNQSPLFSHDGKRFAWSSTARNGKDTDIWVMDFAGRKPRTLVTEGGQWTAMDFSPGGERLLVMKYVSAAESYPGSVDVATGKLEMFPVDGGKASFNGFRFAHDGRAVYFISDEPIDGKAQEFHTLRYHDPATGKFQVLTTSTPWDFEDVEIADDGKHLAYNTNDDGIYQLHLLSRTSHRPLKLPTLPNWQDVNVGFSP